MQMIRRSDERGYFDHGWLRTHHTFSFSDYYDPEFIGFGPLRVINEDFIAAGEGFPTHGHRDMEILTWVIAGAVAHKDSTGGEGVIRPGEMQKMSAGRGIRHSEFNGRKDVETHLFQIWIEPSKRGLDPGYSQTDFNAELALGNPVCVAAPEGQKGSALVIVQDASVWVWRPSAKEALWEIPLAQGRQGWLQVTKGSFTSEGKTLHAGDGLAVRQESAIELICAAEGSEALWFDLP